MEQRHYREHQLSGLVNAWGQLVKTLEDVQMINANGASFSNANFAQLAWQTDVGFTMALEHLVNALVGITQGEVPAHDDWLRDVITDCELDVDLAVPEFDPSTLELIGVQQILTKARALHAVELPLIKHSIFLDLSKTVKQCILVQQSKQKLLELMWKAMHSGYALRSTQDMLSMLIADWQLEQHKLVGLVDDLVAGLVKQYAIGKQVIRESYRQFAPQQFAASSTPVTD